MMKKMDKSTRGCFLVAIISLPLLIVVSIFIPRRFLWVPLEVAGGMFMAAAALYCASSKPETGTHPDAAAAADAAKQLIEILFYDPDHSYINMPDRYQFIKILHWLAYPDGPVVNLKIDPTGLKDAHPADAVRVSKQLIQILFSFPDWHINMPMPDHYQFIKGLYWLAYPQRRRIKLPVVSPKIDPAGLKDADADAAVDAAPVAKQLIEILFFHPDSHMNMPDHYQFIKGLFWLAYPHDRGIKIPVVSPKIDPAGLKDAHPDAAADAAPVAKQLIEILFFHPDSHMNMPDHYQFTKGLFWLAYPHDRGIKLPVVSPRVELDSVVVVNPRIESDAVVINPRIELDAVVVNPRIEPVEVAEDGNLSIQHV